MNKDLNYVAALEKAISDKYGEKAILNPKSGWDESKEKEYLQLTKEKLKLEDKVDREKEYLDLDGVLIQKKLINSANNRKCEYCSRYSFNREDDLYFSKFQTCKKCYVAYIEDREERWKSGWRPNKTEQK